MKILKHASFSSNPGRLIGLIYLLMALFGAFGILYPLSLIVDGDAPATIQNIRASGALFQLSIVSGLVGQTIFVVLAVFLFRLLVTVGPRSALLMLVFALVGIAIGMLNSVNYFAATILLDDSSFVAGLGPEFLTYQVMLFLDMQGFGTLIAQIFWGLWLFPLGLLVYRASFFPKFLGVLLSVACFGYLVSSTVGLALLDYDSAILAMVEGVAGITTLGEIVFVFWLLFRGVNVEQWSIHRASIVETADNCTA